MNAAPTISTLTRSASPAATMPAARPRARGASVGSGSARGHARLAAVALAACALAAGLTGCSSRKPPTFQIVSVNQAERGDDSVLLSFTVEGTNPNPFELPLRDVRYTVAIDGAGDFLAIRSAEATLPRNGSVRFMLPAVIDARVADLRGRAVGYRLSGSVEYRFPDPLSEVLFDTSFRRPSAAISVSGQLDFSGGAGELAASAPDGQAGLAN
jgi:hypothetical protein